MTDLEQLLAACVANPDDDTPRLVYADWLEENGQQDRAEFIRAQIWYQQGQLDAGRFQEVMNRCYHDGLLFAWSGWPDKGEPNLPMWYYRGFLSAIRTTFGKAVKNMPEVVAVNPFIRDVMLTTCHPGRHPGFAGWIWEFSIYEKSDYARYAAHLMAKEPAGYPTRQDAEEGMSKLIITRAKQKNAARWRAARKKAEKDAAQISSTVIL